MEGTSIGDEAGEFSIEGLGGVGGQRLLDGVIIQLVVSLRKIVIPIEDDHGAALII